MSKRIYIHIFFVDLQVSAPRAVQREPWPALCETVADRQAAAVGSLRPRRFSGGARVDHSTEAFAPLSFTYRDECK